MLNTHLIIRYRGGLEMLFNNQNRHQLSLPSRDGDGNPVNVMFLVDYLCQHVMKDSRKELFVLDGGMYDTYFLLARNLQTAFD